MFSDLPNGYYTITPDNVDFDFEPPNYVIQTLTGDTPDMDFVATKFMPCVLEAIYGDDSEEVELLRLVRDNFMSKTPEGRELIKLYYLWSPVIVKTVEQDEGFKEEVKQMIDGVLPMIEDARE
jgi:hypothetical protein